MTETNKTDNPVTPRSVGQGGLYGNRKRIQAALLIIGILGLALAASGIAAFGGHRGWWNAGQLKHLKQAYVITLMTVGSSTATASLVAALIIRHVTALHPLSKGAICRAAHGAVDATYNTPQEGGILDLVFFDAALGFGCVVDGTGHNKPPSFAPLNDPFVRFINEYKNGLQHLKNLEDAHRYFQQAMNTLHSTYTGGERDNPAMSFAQIFKCADGNTFLFSAQFGDTSLFILDKQEKLSAISERHLRCGLGSSDIQNVKITRTNISNASKVIGISDGIGDYLPKESFEKHIKEESSTVFGAIKTDLTNEAEKTGPALGIYELKNLNKNDPARSDDIGLFILDL